MQINSDFSDLLHALNGGGVRYLVVGGYAVMRYSEPRYTKDLDLWADPEAGNAHHLFAALAKFGAPLTDLTPAAFQDESMIYQIGVAPIRVDIIMAIGGVQFADAWERREQVDLGGLAVPIISREDLIAAKRASGRPQDRMDLQRMLRAQSKEAWRPPKGKRSSRRP